MTDRIPCCVPFCKRTAKASGDENDMICRTHGMAVSRPTRLFWMRMKRKSLKAQEREPEDCTEQEQRHVLRLDAIRAKAWERFKVEAIESAGGLR